MRYASGKNMRSKIPEKACIAQPSSAGVQPARAPPTGAGAQQDSQQPRPTTNQQCVSGEVLKKLSNKFPTLPWPDCDGCVPSDWKSAATQVKPSERAVVPLAQR